jgi:RND family efflux transporter MFP subunit
METKKADLNSLRINRAAESSGTSSKKILIPIITIGIILLLIGGYFIVSGLLNPAVEVKVTTAILQTPAQTNAILTASGYVVAQRKASVASKGTGRLVYLGVVEGDQVKKNQIIARLEDNDIKAMLEEAKANLKLVQAGLIAAENNFNRQRELFKTGSTTKMAVDAAEAEYNRVVASIEVAKANLVSAEVALENTLIRAPFDGTVLTKNAEVGEIVAPLGASVTSRGAVVTMADMNSLQVEADVSESNIEKISLNQECEIILDAYPEKGYPAFVAKIVPTADRSKATVLVKVGFKEYDERVLPEMSAKVSFLTKDLKEQASNEKPMITLPFTAIANRNGNKVVYIIKDDKAVEVPVTTGREFGSFTEIKTGISEGDRVIERVTEEIQEGTSVKVI